MPFRERLQGHTHKIHLNVQERERFIYLINTLRSIDGFGADIRENYTFTALMVNASCWFQMRRMSPHILSEQYQNRHCQTERILSYIDRHLEEPLNLETIASHISLSPAYMSRLFKSATGTTINKYIIAKRIAHAKRLFADGRSVSDVFEHSGFNDYSNFYKSFKKATGLSPTAYASGLRAVSR